MKKLLIAVAVLGMIGCVDNRANVKSENEISKPVMQQYGVNLDDYPNAKTDFSLEQEYQYVAAEQYGSVAFKAIGACFAKYEPMLNDIDTSTDYGSSVLTDFDVKNAKCVEETLSTFDKVPEELRKKIPRENAELELTVVEQETYNEVPADFDRYAGEDMSEAAPVAPVDKSSDRYTELKKICSENNSEAVDFKEAVEFCVAKSM